MCAAAALWTGISRIVFGVSVDQLRRWGWRQIGIPAEEVVRRMPGAACEVTGGILETECARLFENLA
jgi:tRNA(Arg) A34 adenosine deaminase TadA